MSDAMPSAVPPSFVQRAHGLGEALRGAFTRGLVSVQAEELGTKDLADRLGCTAVLASRLRKALGAPSGAAVLLASPGIGPLESVRAGLERLGAPAEVLAALEEAIGAFDQLLRTGVRDRRALETMLAEAHPDGLEAFEHTRRQTVFRAFSEGQGLFADLMVDTTILTPTEEPGLAAGHSMFSARGLQSLRAGTSFQWSAYEGPPQVISGLTGSIEAPAQEDDGPRTSALDFAAFAENPLGSIKVSRLPGNTTLHSVEFDGFGLDSRVDLFSLDTITRSLPSGPPALGSPRRMGLCPGSATRRFVTEVFVHPALFEGAAPELRLQSLAGTGPVPLAAPDFQAAQRQVTGVDQDLGAGLEAWALEGESHHQGLLAAVFDHLGLDPREHRGFRYDAPFLYPWSQPVHCWFHPDDPLRD